MKTFKVLAALLAYPQPELLAREVLINLQSQDTFIKGASTRQISDVQGDMVKTRTHARHATARHATRSWAGFAVLADAAELVRLSCWGHGAGSDAHMRRGPTAGSAATAVRKGLRARGCHAMSSGAGCR